MKRTGNCLSLLCLFLLLSGCSVNPVTGKKELILIPEAQEIALGLQSAPEFEKKFGGAVGDQRVQSYVRRVGKRISDASDRRLPYEFTLVASEVPNAFALPGGKIFITVGLMGRLTGEDQLAAVLAHETAHCAAKHNVKGLQRQMGAAVVAEIAGHVAGEEKAEAAKAVTKFVTGMANLRYSRNDEYQADEVGVLYASRAGYNPWGMVDLLKLLLRLAGKEPDTFAEMFLTHPLTSKRIERVEQTLRSDKQYSRFSPAAPGPTPPELVVVRKMLGSSSP
jgi:predicted Zn-dependent protease